MIKKLRIFVDSDVVISSMLSDKGAGYTLINTPNLEKVISNYSKEEIKRVIKRLGITDKKLNVLDAFQLVKLKISIDAIKNKYGKYVKDKNDAHIVAGAQVAKVGFLMTYNVKDYLIENIKRDLGVIILTPGMFLQYLRSKN